LAIKEINYNNKIFNISYEIIKSNLKDNIIFLHGWGSNKEIMKKSFSKKFTKELKQIYIDLPGFGKSSNGYILSSDDYLNIISLFLKAIQIKPYIIMGHSFGGKIAVRLQPKLLILLSSAGIPKKKSLKTRTKIKIFKFLKPFAPKNLYKLFASKDVENMPHFMYETLKNVVNEDYKEYFKNYNGLALIFWGKNDKDTPLESGKKIANLIENSYFYQYNGNHFFFLNHSKNIVKRIEDFL